MFRLKIDEAMEGLDLFRDRLLSIKHLPDYAGPLMERWERIIEEDNREGVLLGQDKDGSPAPILSYRPRNRAGFVGPPGGKRLTVAQRLGQRGRPAPR